MSREAVEVVRACYDAYAARDYERMLERFSPDIEFDLTRRVIDPAIYRGHAGVREYLAAQGDVWSKQRLEPQDYVAIGDHFVVVPMRVVSTGRASGLDVVAHSAWIWEVRSGLAVRATAYQSYAEAMEATERQQQR